MNPRSSFFRLPLHRDEPIDDFEFLGNIEDNKLVYDFTTRLNEQLQRVFDRKFEGYDTFIKTISMLLEHNPKNLNQADILR